eukprot:Trichotokara_eunicae@DN6118_c0_g1_i3.p1
MYSALIPEYMGSAKKDFGIYLALLKVDGVLLTVGMPSLMGGECHFHPFSVVPKRRGIIGSCIGGMKETQEMIDFCAKHDLLSDIEIINVEDCWAKYEDVEKSRVKYRFVMEMDKWTPKTN